MSSLSKAFPVNARTRPFLRDSDAVAVAVAITVELATYINALVVKTFKPPKLVPPLFPLTPLKDIIPVGTNV